MGVNIIATNECFPMRRKLYWLEMERLATAAAASITRRKFIRQIMQIIMESFAVFHPPRWQQLSPKRALSIISRFAKRYRKTKNIFDWNFSSLDSIDFGCSNSAEFWIWLDFVSQMTLAARMSSPATTDDAYRVAGFATVTMTAAMDRMRRNARRRSAIQSNSSSARRSIAWRRNGDAMENSTVLTDPMKEWVGLPINRNCLL